LQHVVCTSAENYRILQQLLTDNGSNSSYSKNGEMPAMATPQQEKRSAPRKAVKVPAKVHTAETEIQAEALNLSQSGIFLECATRVSAGSPVDIVMILPKDITGDVAKWVCCRATVQRVDDTTSNGRYGVAATVDRIQAMPEATWPEVDRRITERRGNDRRKAPRAEGRERRSTDRRNSGS
jgi:hypothetical protein